MSKAVTITYVLHPPEGTDTPTLSRTKVMTFDIESNTDRTYAGYYDGLRTAVEDARTAIGDDLTAWRDAIGAAEGSKEAKKILADEDDEEDDGEQ
ncbi:hypothetical protein PC9H_002939 [Pleurotus ostreatus]|uniref:Uncharacterized protein n=1 Tax=Pleurotus ostreatus TaxID=5322 RepID=A0A8H6ZY28_PLEOS|nr:uncharacterized protein PC9H_002939 [Pleurotus ostreatus]KAF7436113.1 hypothetical protein PC9H_002939 [Pleurotus ostreatus]KAJ8701749.1 hypothetical protein PTI98_000503 [Pleurotus ostreatus]